MRKLNFSIRLVNNSLRIIYNLLYHQFSWSYDFVAWAVSMGQWWSWVSCVQNHIKTETGDRVMELGHGTGHLLESFQQKGIFAVGLDESYWMSRRAAKRLRRHSHPQRLVNGVAGSLPFESLSFQHVVATFPGDYIFKKETLREVYRVLDEHGMFIILPIAWLTGKKWYGRFFPMRYQTTVQATNSRIIDLETVLQDPFRRGGIQYKY